MSAGMVDSLNYNCIFNVVQDFYVQNMKHFKIGHLNINSFRNKFEPIREILQENVLDLMVIQETKLDNCFPPNQFSILNYTKAYRRDFKHNKGGSLMFVRNDMPRFHRLDIDDFNMDNSDGRIELIGLEVTINKEKWVFISIYKQPKVQIIHLVEIMDNIMIQLSQQESNIVFIGDFNVNMLQRNELSDWLEVNGLRNLVKNPTCFKSTPFIN